MIDLDSPMKPSRRDSILDSAANQLACFGVGDSSLPKIASCMGITRSALYYYAKSKEDLIAQVYRRSCDLLVDSAERSRTSSSLAFAQLEFFVRTTVLRPGIDIIPLNELGMLEPDLRSDLTRRHNTAVTSISAILTGGMSRGELRKCDPDVAARTVISIVEQLCLVKAWTRTNAAISSMVGTFPTLPELCDNTLDMLRNGWLADRNSQFPVEITDLSPLMAPLIRAFDKEGQAIAKREELLLIASRLFNCRGVSSTTLDDIAAELGITKRSIYHHVGDKQTLLAACHERSRQIIRHIHADYQRRVEKGACPVAAYVNLIRSNALSNLMPDVAPMRSSRGLAELREEDKRGHSDFVHWLTDVTRQQRAMLARAGAMRPINEATLDLVHIGSVNWLAGNWESVGPEVKIDVACGVIDVLMRGFAPIESESETG